jgi:hypothetical protein
MKQFLSPADRYKDDPVFRQLVDVIQMVLHDAVMTPTEVREAAVLACCQYEMLTIRPMLIPVRDLDSDVTNRQISPRWPK